MSTQTSRVTLVGEMLPAYNEILTPEALSFLKELHENFNERRTELLQKRVEKQKRIDAGEFPKFLEETKHIREGDWTIAELPKDLEDRRVEITGPVDRKMVINALNSGAHLLWQTLKIRMHQLGEMLSKVKLTYEMRVRERFHIKMKTEKNIV